MLPSFKVDVGGEDARAGRPALPPAVAAGAGAQVIQLPFEPTAKQLEAATACLDPDARIIALDGAYRSGKTQVAGRLLVEWAIEQPAVYLVARATYRTLKDSTQRAMLRGDGSLPPLIPPEAVERYRASDETVVLRNGAEILFRSLEADQPEKLRGLTLAGALIDQAEELDDGVAGEGVFDTILGRLSDPRGPRKLIVLSNPAGLTHWLYQRVINPGTRDRRVRHVQFRLTDNPHLTADYVADMVATKETRPHWYRSFVLGEWGAFEGQAYAEFDEQVHVVDPFEVPEWWQRFESMDHGAANPTAWLAWAADDDGNVVVFGEHYEAGRLVSHHAQRVLELRQGWHPAEARGRVTVWADPSTGAKFGTSRWGEAASVQTEYAEHGIALTGANNDRAAGYARLLELLHVEQGRPGPTWSRVAGGDAAPRMFVFSTCRQLIAQLKSAPVAADGVAAGLAVDANWESAHGHAHAAARYGAMSRPRGADTPEEPLDDPRAEMFWRFSRERESRPKPRRFSVV